MENESLPEQIEPLISERKLDEILTMEGTIVDSPERLQRNEIRNIMEEQGFTPSSEVLGLIVACLQWRNQRPAVALWAGHIQRAQELLSDPRSFQSVEAVEAALIERFTQPAYEENDPSRTDLVDGVLPIVRSSAISQVRPEIWEDDQLAKAHVREIVNTYVGDKNWDLPE